MSRRLLLALALSLGAARAQAAFQSQFHSARTAVLGGAALAAGPEPFALFLNPAGLAKLESPELYFTYTRLHAGMAGDAGMGLGAMAAAASTRHGTLAAGLALFSAPGLAQERTAALGFARQLGPVRLGVTAKHLHHGFAPAGDARAERDPVFARGTSKSAFGADVGAIVRAAEDVRLSFAARNVNRPDVGLATEDRVPVELNGGAVLAIPRSGVAFSLDASWREGAVSDPLPIVPRVGVEKAAAEDRVLLRAAVSSLDLVIGVGIQFGRVGIDYAALIQRRLVADSFGTHRVGLSWRFGRESLADKRLKTYRPNAPDRRLRNTMIRRARRAGEEQSFGWSLP